MNQTELRVGKIALGTALFGTAVPTEQAFLLMDAFVENGGNLLDTAAMYADWLSEEKGVSEKVLGKWMKERGNRSRMVIATKGGHPPVNAMHISRINRADIETDINNSLRNLMTDCVDLYYLHRDDVKVPVGEIMGILNELVTEGKIRYAAVSNWCPARIQEAMTYCKEHGLSNIVSSQIQFSVAHPNPQHLDPTTEYMDKEHYAFYQEQDMSVLAFSSQAGGYFLRTDEQGRLRPNRQYDNEINQELYGVMNQMCGKYQCTMEEMATGALCSNPDFMTIPIIGCSRKEHLLASLAGADLQLSPEDARQLLERRYEV